MNGNVDFGSGRVRWVTDCVVLGGHWLLTMTMVIDCKTLCDEEGVDCVVGDHVVCGMLLVVVVHMAVSPTAGLV